MKRLTVGEVCAIIDLWVRDCVGMRDCFSPPQSVSNSRPSQKHWLVLQYVHTLLMALSCFYRLL